MASEPTLNLQRGDTASNNSVKIPTMTARSQINALPSGPRAGGETFSNDIGRALMNVGSAINNVSEQNDRQAREQQRLREMEIAKEKERQTLAASANAADSTIALQQDFVAQQQEAKDGADGFANTIQSRINQHIEDATKDATPYYAEQYKKQMQHVRTHLMGNAIAYQNEEGLKYEVDQLATTADKSAVAVKTDPTLYDIKLNEITDTINSNTKLKADIKRDMLTKARNQLNLAAGQGYIDANPIQFNQTLQHAGGDYHMPEVSPAVGKYSDIVSRASERTGVNASILTAQLAAESGGNPNALSPKGAQGVAQFMPATAQRYGVDVTDPVSSIVGQARYMGDLLNMFGGDYAKALAGYNWGEGNVKKAQQQYGADWLDHAPKETRNYVAKIMQDTGGNTPHMEISHGSVIPASLIGQPWFDNATLEQQQQLKQYAQVKATGAIAQVGVDMATSVANSLVSDKPINLNAATSQTIKSIESRYGPLTPEQKQAVEHATSSAVSRAESNWQRNREGQLVTAYDALDKSGGDYAAFVAGNPTVFAQMTSKQKDEVNKYAGFVKQGGNVATNWDKYLTLMDNPKFMIGKDLNALKGEMNLTQLNQLKAVQQQVSNNPVAEDNLQGDNAVIKQQLVKAGVEDKDRQGEFISILQQKVDEELLATGKKSITQQEKLKLANDLLVNVVSNKRWYWFDKVQPVGTIKEIPADVKQKFVAALSSAGMPVNDYNLLKQYKLYLEATNGKAN